MQGKEKFDVRSIKRSMNIRLFFITSLIVLHCFPLYSQLGGRYTFSFLDLNYSARSSALGMPNVPILDKDISLAIGNPSLLNEAMHNFTNLSFSNYLSDIAYGNASYARSFENDYTGMAAIRYINYGEFIKADEYGNQNGTFSAGEYALSLSLSKKLKEHFYTGASLQFIYSAFERYYSSGLALDYALTYHKAEENLTATLLVSNLGFQLKPYSPGNREPLPLNIQLGFSKKPQHMPLRFIVVAHHLNKLNFAYADPNKPSVINFGDNSEQGDKVPLSEKVFRHFNVGGEMVLSENFHLRFGYDHQRRKEMKIPGKPGLVGFSLGFGLRISKFYLSYGNTIYHVAGTSNNFSVSFNPQEFVRKEKKKD